jgi:hypothetical protein
MLPAFRATHPDLGHGPFTKTTATPQLSTAVRAVAGEGFMQ